MSIYAILLAISSVQATEQWAIVNANIINPVGKIKPKLGYVIIQGDKILQVRMGKFAKSHLIKTIDAQHAYLIPGLIDSHIHVDTLLGFNDDTAQLHPTWEQQYRQQLPKSFLYFGFTTLIDFFTADSKLVTDFQHTPLHPDLFTSGGGVTEYGGYPMSEMPPAERISNTPNFIISNASPTVSKKINLAEHTPAAIIQRIVNNHAVCVKLFYEPGFAAEHNLPLISLNNAKALIVLAHQHQLPVIVHANSYSTQQFALAAGVDAMAHGLWNWGPYNNETVLVAPIKAVLDKIIAQHVAYQPTTQTIGGLVSLYDKNYLQDPHLAKVLPAEFITWYRSAEGQWYAKQLQGTQPLTEFVARRKKVFQHGLLALQYLAQHHALILFGTDTPSGPTYANPPGYNGYLEMQNWSTAGLSPTEVLQAATINNAKFFHLANKYGTIAPAKIANLLLLKENPLKSTTAYDSLTAVILHGNLYQRDVFAVSK